MLQSCIEVSCLTKDFKSYKKYPGFAGAIKSLFTRETVTKRAVDDVSFSINTGEIVGYIGANGAGKSTTIKMMSGVLTPTSGQCVVAGLIPYKNRMVNARNIGVVFGQRTQLWWDLPLTETFQILKEIYDVPENDFRERMDYLNDVLGLPEFASSTVRTLSLGQRMRADLAASLLHNPPVLYLDEPTIGLDVVVKERIREAIKGINAKHQTTIILTTHDLRDIEELCGRIIIIDSGKILYDGSQDEIKSKYGNTAVLTVTPKNMDAFLRTGVTEAFMGKDASITCAEADGSAAITFDKNKISAAELLNFILPKVPVSDIIMGETSIEDIVKRIYNKGIPS